MIYPAPYPNFNPADAWEPWKSLRVATPSPLKHLQLLRLKSKSPDSAKPLRAPNKTLNITKLLLPSTNPQSLLASKLLPTKIFHKSIASPKPSKLNKPLPRTSKNRVLDLKSYRSSRPSFKVNLNYFDFSCRHTKALAETLSPTQPKPTPRYVHRVGTPGPWKFQPSSANSEFDDYLTTHVNPSSLTSLDSPS